MGRVGGAVGHHVGHEGGGGVRGVVWAGVGAERVRLSVEALVTQRVDGGGLAHGCWVCLLAEEHVWAQTFAGVVRVAVGIWQKVESNGKNASTHGAITAFKHYYNLDMSPKQWSSVHLSHCNDFHFSTLFLLQQIRC